MISFIILYKHKYHLNSCISSDFLKIAVVASPDICRKSFILMGGGRVRVLLEPRLGKVADGSRTRNRIVSFS